MNPLAKIHPSWGPIENILKTDRKLIELNEKILPNIKFYPKAENIFNVFTMPVEDIKVVILGQDPYPNEGQAIGYSFAVNRETNVPRSLHIIGQELINERYELNLGQDWRTFQHWINQGVFLLNTALTVEARKPGSHIGYWKDFTFEVIKHIKQHKKNCIWMLWGRKAQEYKEFIRPGHILEASHPVVEAYGHIGQGFYGCNHFNKANQIMESLGGTKINW